MIHNGSIRAYVIASLIVFILLFSNVFLDRFNNNAGNMNNDVVNEAYMLLNMMKPQLVEEYGVINVTKYEGLTSNPLPKYDFINGNPGSWTIVKGSAIFDASLPNSLKIRVDGHRWNTALKIQGDSQGFSMYSSLSEWKEILAGAPLMVYGIASSDSTTSLSDVNVGVEYSVGGGGGCPILFIKEGSGGEKLVTNVLAKDNEVIAIDKPVRGDRVELVIRESGDSIIELKSLGLHMLPMEQAKGYMIVQSGDYNAVYLVDEDKLMEPFVMDVMGNKLQLHIEDMDQFYTILQPKDPLLAIVDKNTLNKDKLLLIIKFRDPNYYVKSSISIKVLSNSGFIDVAGTGERIITGSVLGFEVPLKDIKEASKNVVLIMIESSTIQYVDYIGFTTTYKILDLSTLKQARLVHAELDGKEIDEIRDTTIATNGSLRLIFEFDEKGYPVLKVGGSVNITGDTIIRITRDYTRIGSVVIRHKANLQIPTLTSSNDPVWNTISSPIVYLPDDPDSINYIRVVAEAPAYSENYLAYLKFLLEPIAVSTGYNPGTYPYDLISTGLVGLYYVSKNPLNQQYILYFIAIYERYALFGGYPGQLFDVVDRQNITVGWFTNSEPSDVYIDFDGLTFYFNDENLDSSTGGYSSMADTVATIAGALGTLFTFIAFKAPPSYQTYLAYASIASDVVGEISNMLVDDNRPPIYIVPLLPGNNLEFMYMVLDYNGDVSYTVLSEKRVEVQFNSDDLPVYSFIIFNRENPAVYGDFDWEDPDSIIIWLNFYS